MRRFWIIGLVAVLASCGGSSGGSSSSGGSNGGSSGGASGGGLASIALASADVPSGYSLCSQFSGGAASNPDQNVKGEFQYQQAKGVVDAYVTVYAASPGDCASFTTLGPAQKPSTSKVIGSVVSKWKDAASATAAEMGGAFGIGVSPVRTATGGPIPLGGKYGTSSFFALLISNGGEGAVGWEKDVYFAGIAADGISQPDLNKVALAVFNRTP
jgi:hypothetical protein